MKAIASAVVVLGMMGGAAGLSAQTEESKKLTHENVRVVTDCDNLQPNWMRLSAAG
jgi:hypothetical protein